MRTSLFLLFVIGILFPLVLSNAPYVPSPSYAPLSTEADINQLLNNLTSIQNIVGETDSVLFFLVLGVLGTLWGAVAMILLISFFSTVSRRNREIALMEDMELNDPSKAAGTGHEDDFATRRCDMGTLAGASCLLVYYSGVLCFWLWATFVWYYFVVRLLSESVIPLISQTLEAVALVVSGFPQLDITGATTFFYAMSGTVTVVVMIPVIGCLVSSACGLHAACTRSRTKASGPLCCYHVGLILSIIGVVLTAIGLIFPLVLIVIMMNNDVFSTAVPSGYYTYALVVNGIGIAYFIAALIVMTIPCLVCACKLRRHDKTAIANGSYAVGAASMSHPLNSYLASPSLRNDRALSFGLDAPAPSVALQPPKLSSVESNYAAPFGGPGVSQGDVLPDRPGGLSLAGRIDGYTPMPDPMAGGNGSMGGMW